MLVDIRRVEHPLDHRRGKVNGGDPLAGDGAQDVRRIELAVQHDGAAPPVLRGLEAAGTDMEERQATSSRPSPARPSSLLTTSASRAMPRWVCATPLGRPVVPLV